VTATIRPSLHGLRGHDATCPLSVQERTVANGLHMHDLRQRADPRCLPLPDSERVIGSFAIVWNQDHSSGNVEAGDWLSNLFQCREQLHRLPIQLRYDPAGR
jgi:hypothetical protein